MNLDKDNIKKILLIIVFTVAVFTAFENLREILYYTGILLTVLIPFIIGGAMAFALNIPMKAIEDSLFKSNKILKKEVSDKISRPLSLILSIIFLVIIIIAVVNIVVPQLINTLYSIGNSIYDFIPRLKDYSKYVIGNFFGSDDINYYIEKLMNFDWHTAFGYIANFIKSGGSMINSTIGVVTTIFSTTVNIVVGFIFAIYILLQKEKLSVQAKKVIFAFFKKDIAEKLLDIAAL